MKSLKGLIVLILILMIALAVTSYSKSKPKDSDSPNPPSPTTPDVVITEITGIYIGQIDNSSIEINVDGKDQAFRFSDKLRSSFESLGLIEGQMVKALYAKNKDNQLVLEELTPIQNPGIPLNSDSKTVSGVYVGKIDSNSIEIKVGSETQAFWVAEELKSGKLLSTLKEGDKIEFEYYNDDYNRAVITTFQIK